MRPAVGTWPAWTKGTACDVRSYTDAAANHQNCQAVRLYCREPKAVERKYFARS